MDTEARLQKLEQKLDAMRAAHIAMYAMMRGMLTAIDGRPGVRATVATVAHDLLIDELDAAGIDGALRQDAIEAHECLEAILLRP